jgi:hypothetical protein
MHTLQRPPAKVESKALNYMHFMHHIVLNNNCDRHFVLNMDQMPVCFLMSAKCMLQLTGNQTVHICMLSDNTKWVTITVTIAADGTVLLSMLVFIKVGQIGTLQGRSLQPTQQLTITNARQMHGWMRW